MDQNSKLESLVASQKDQLNRYEIRLKDVINAYKGLLKEKDALKEALNVANKPKGETGDQSPGGDNNIDQKLTLMNSLATLSAEKSRIEQSFLLDKRNLKQEITSKDKALKELEETIRSLESRNSLETENFKSKLIVEKHLLEKEQTNSMLMIRELQMLLNDERHLKENLEMQLSDLKTQFSQTSNSDRAIKELSQELDDNRKKIKQIEYRNNFGQDNSFVLDALQKEMLSLKKQHEIAICNEQRRALIAEDRNKQLAVLHEERVSNLESRLTDLSNTIGSYDRLRQLDQESIFKLKEKIAQVSVIDKPDNETKHKSQLSVQSLLDEIMLLKNTLMFENASLELPIDISKIFVTRSNSEDAYDKLKQDLVKLEAEKANQIKQITELKENVNTLQEKVKVLNTNIEDYEQDSRAKLTEHTNELRLERNKLREITSAMEIDFRSKTSQLEQQIQKQRDRSLVLLEEKESELRSLKASYEVFLPRSQNDVPQIYFDNDEENGYLNTRSSVQQPSGFLNKLNSKETHIVHFFNELSRKDQELANLRKSKIEIENCLRQTLREKIMIQENLDEKILNLEQQVDRLENNKSREGANLEYLKNVIISFLVSSDADDKRHMLNAIGAVLKFNLLEMESISNYFSFKK